MLTLKHILFPVDFSRRCEGAAPFVASLARQFGAEVTLLSVLPPVWQTTVGDPTGTLMIDMEELRKDMQTRLAGYLLPQFAGIPARRIARIGDPSMTITESAHSEKVDLIMLPTHGWGPFRSLLLGSTASKVLHDAACPVWTEAHAEESMVHAHEKIRTIVCAVDGTPQSVPLMQWAEQFAMTSGASLRLVHAVTGIGGWPEAPVNQDFEESLKKQAEQTIEQQKQASGITAPLCVAVGETAAVIREEASRHNADLVIIGRGLLDATLGRLRTHSYTIIRQSPCPVISV